jgi:hypothetical protein
MVVVIAINAVVTVVAVIMMTIVIVAFVVVLILVDGCCYAFDVALIKVMAITAAVMVMIV